MSKVPVTHVPACPPMLHIVDSSVAVNATTSEIEQTITLHEGVKFTLCYSTPLALRTSVFLDAATEQLNVKEAKK